MHNFVIETSFQADLSLSLFPLPLPFVVTPSLVSPLLLLTLIAALSLDIEESVTRSSKEERDVSTSDILPDLSSQAAPSGKKWLQHEAIGEKEAMHP